MGTIRIYLVYVNPCFELCGVCDMNLEAAERVAETHLVCCILHIVVLVERR